MVTSQTALSGLRVIELSTGMPGGLAGLILAQYGADVLRVERPGGSRSGKVDGSRIWNEGKRTQQLDLESEQDAARLRELVTGADVFLHTLRRSTIDRLGLGYLRLRAWNSALIYCSIAGFDEGSLYDSLPGYDGLVAAKTGRGSIYQDQVPRSGPVYPAVPIGAYGAAQGALQGIFAALWRRRQTGRGGRVGSSLVRGMLCYDMWDWLLEQFPERVGSSGDWIASDNRGRRARVGGLAFTTGATRDGHWIQFANIDDHLFYRFMRCLGLDDLYMRPGFDSLPNVSPEMHVRARDLILQAVRTRDLAEWQEIFETDGSVGYELIRGPSEVASHAQVAHNGHLTRSATGGLLLAPPWTIDGKRVGKHVESQAVAAQTVSGAEWPARPQGTAPFLPAAEESTGSASISAGHSSIRGSGLLSDVVVLELGGYYAGPFAGRLLADHGARVIKVEPLTGDPMRALRNGLANVQALFGKESVSIDLKSPFGRDVLFRLVRGADVLYHNFRPHVAASLGFGPDDVLRLKPDLIYVYAASYGSTGPMTRRPAYDPIPAAITGCAHRQGGGFLPPDPAATRTMSTDDIAEFSRMIGLTSGGVSDPSGALLVATSIIYGLLVRARTGRGGVFENTMLAASIYANMEAFDPHLPYVERLQRDGLGLSPLYRLYQADDGWVFLACADKPAWEALRAAYLSNSAAASLGFAEAWTSDEVNRLLEERFAQQSAATLEATGLQRGIACLASLDSRAALPAQQWIRDSGVMTTTTDRLLGSYARYGALTDTDDQHELTVGAPILGEHTRTVLQELGFSEEEIDTAIASRSVRCWEEARASTVNNGRRS